MLPLFNAPAVRTGTARAVGIFFSLAATAILITPLGAEAKRAILRPYPAVRTRAGQGTCTTGPAPGLAPIAQPHLNYCGGRVLSHAQIVAVLWGPPDPVVATPTCGANFQACLDGYYQNLVNSPQFDWLDEYQTTIPALNGMPGTNQHIGRPTYYGSVVITPINAAAIIGEVDTENELVAQIQAGHLPAPNTADETIYEVHFPLEVDPSDPAECREACQDYCAYHDSWHSNILGTNGLLAIIPSHMPPGYTGRDCSQCGERTDWFANLGGSISHETIEAITDPDVGGFQGGCAPPLGWYDTSGVDAMSVHGEIGDMCEGMPDTTQRNTSITEVSFPSADSGVYSVQREWSNQYSSCLGSVDDAFNVVGPATQVLAVVGGSTNVNIQTTLPEDAGAPLPVKFSIHGLPAAGVAATFSPSIVDASGSTTLTFAIDATATQTGFPFGVVGESGSSQTQTVLSIAAPEFAASLTPQTTIALTAGGDAVTETLESSVTTGVQRGFTVAAAGIPGISVSPDAGVLGTSLTLSIKAAAGTPSSNNTLAVDVTSAAVTHVIPLQVNISGDDVLLSAPGGLSVHAGSSTQFTLTTTTKAGNPQALHLSAINVPSGAIISFTPETLSSGQTSKVSVSLPDSQTPAPIDVTVVAAGPIAKATLNVPLTVTGKSGCTSTSAAAWALLGLLALGVRLTGKPARL